MPCLIGYRCLNLTGSGSIVDVDIVGPFRFCACLLFFISLVSHLGAFTSFAIAIALPAYPSPAAAAAMACAASVAATSASASLASASAAAQSKLPTHNGLVLAAPAHAHNKAAVAFVANKARVSMRSAHSSTRTHSLTRHYVGCFCMCAFHADDDRLGWCACVACLVWLSPHAALLRTHWSPFRVCHHYV